MTTVTNVRMALDETRLDKAISGTPLEAACKDLMHSPTALTILANRLSDRGDAGNQASGENLKELEALAYELAASDHVAFAALEWAIDQLTPPERAPVTVYGKPVSELTDAELESAAKANDRRGATHDLGLAALLMDEAQRRQAKPKLTHLTYGMAEGEERSTFETHKPGPYTVAKNPAGVGWVVVKGKVIQTGKFYIEADAQKRADRLNCEADSGGSECPYCGGRRHVSGLCPERV